MSVGRMARGGARVRSSAVRRLAGARDEHARLVAVCQRVAGRRSEPLADSWLGAARAYVASREAWLHWIDEGESLEPWADGDWAQPGNELAEAAETLQQELATADQMAADSDQAVSDSEQAQAERDQHSSDRDQAVDDWRLAQGPSPPAAAKAHEVSRVEREAVSQERDLTAEERSRSTARRLTTAAQRDEIAEVRDRAAAERDLALDEEDEAADASDKVLEARERAAVDAGEERMIAPLRATRVVAEAVRRKAARERHTAAADREQAAADREQAAADRRFAGLDELTGMFRRGTGELALTREIDRWRRSGQSLVVAVIDVDSLKAVNDSLGHAAGDALLRDVATAITSAMRSYDATVRWGGDEFVCALSDVTLEVASDRVSEIQQALETRRPGASISAGLALLTSNDTLETLIARADAALYSVKTDRASA
jgi:diguanylate cyclase (GGDEF)-like protein